MLLQQRQHGRQGRVGGQPGGDLPRDTELHINCCGCTNETCAQLLLVPPAPDVVSGPQDCAAQRRVLEGSGMQVVKNDFLGDALHLR